MIASVRGTVVSLSLDGVVIDVGGIGVAVRCAPHTLAELRTGSAATVHTSLVVRDDSLTLFGFASTDERGLFETLQVATGVGPKLAQTMLAVLRPDDLRRAVADADLATLTRVPGIGRKGAERIVVELRDRIGPPAADTDATRPSAQPGWGSPVREALIGLGWSAKEADAAIEAIAPEADGADLPTLLREALRTRRPA